MAGVKGQVQRRGEERRRQILDAAMGVFGAQGSGAISVKAVAAAAGVTPSLVLHHFGSRERLLLAVLRERQRRGAEDLVDEVTAAGGLETVRQIIRIARYNEAGPGFAAAYIAIEGEAIDPGAAAHEWFAGRNQGVSSGWAAALRVGIERGEIRDDVDCEALGNEILAFLDGAALTWLIDPQRLSLVALYRSYLNRVIRSIAVDDDPELIP